jgi:hypothetical protein
MIFMPIEKCIFTCDTLQQPFIDFIEACDLIREEV